MDRLSKKDINSGIRIRLLLLCIIVTAIGSSCSIINPNKNSNPDMSYVASISDDIAIDTEAEANIEEWPISEPSQILKNTPTPILDPDPKLEIAKDKEPTESEEYNPTEAQTQENTEEKKLTKAQTPTKTPTKATEEKSTVSPKPKKKTDSSSSNVTANSEYSKQANKIINKLITKDMKDVEKVKAVHDYIVINTKYDIKGLENDNLPDSAFSPEGVFEKGKAVCQGYAETFQLFMELLNIESKLVIGTDLISGLGHSWNMVSLDNKWYHIDVTWDDPVPDQGENVQYKYFLIRDEDIEKDHKWKKSDYPKCESTDYLYYIYYDYIVDSIDDIEAKFMDQYNKGLREITLLYPENDMPDFEFMYDYEYLWKEVDGELKLSYSYYPLWRLGDYYVLTVYME